MTLASGSRGAQLTAGGPPSRRALLVRAHRPLGILGLCAVLSCVYDDVTDTSIGRLRCVHAQCTVRNAVAIAAAREPADLRMGQATIRWRQPLPCGDGQGCAGVIQDEGVSTDALPWLVEDDGTMSVVVPQVDILGSVRRVAVWVARLSAEGVSLAMQHVIDYESPADRFAAPNAKAAIAHDRDGSTLLAVTSGDPLVDVARMVVFSLSAAGPARRLFEIDRVGTPASIAPIGDDLIVLSTAGSAPELTRYGREGSVRWRQVALRPNTPDELNVMNNAGAQMLVTSEETVLVTLQVGSGAMLGGQWLVRVDGAGSVLDVVQTSAEGSLWLGSRKGGLVPAANGDFLLGYGAYAVARCPARGCVPAISLAKRERTQYYDPLLFGLDVDATQRVYVLTQAGVRDAREVLIDRLSPELDTRETFVLHAEVTPGSQQAIHVRADGAIYYLANDGKPEIGLIDLE